MSKSKKNVIDPEFIIENYGATQCDCLFYQTTHRKMFNGPSKNGVILQIYSKIMGLHCEIKSKILNEDKVKNDTKIEEFTNLTISKITYNLEKFNYNVIIANLYETYNYLASYIKTNKNIKNLRKL